MCVKVYTNDFGESLKRREQRRETSRLNQQAREGSADVCGGPSLDGTEAAEVSQTKEAPVASVSASLNFFLCRAKPCDTYQDTGGVGEHSHRVKDGCTQLHEDYG